MPPPGDLRSPRGWTEGRASGLPVPSKPAAPPVSYEVACKGWSPANPGVSSPDDSHRRSIVADDKNEESVQPEAEVDGVEVEVEVEEVKEDAEEGSEETREEYSVCGEDLLTRVKELVREGNIRRITIRSDEGNTLIEIPLAIGVVGAMLLPVWAAVGAIAALVTNCTIAVERRED